MKRISISGLLAALILFPLSAHMVAAAPQTGSLIKASGPTVYYYAADGKRYVFPTEKTFFTWYSDFSGVNTITDSELGAIPVGGNVTYRPGTRLIKVTTDPKVYAVDTGRKLRWIQTEQAANQLFGAGWNTKIDDLPDTFFINYDLGAPIAQASDYSPNTVSNAHPTIQTTLSSTFQTVPAANAAGAFGWGSYMDTNINASSFYGSDHTVALWFLPQYERAYEGPLVSNVGSGKLLIEQGDYLIGGGKPNILVNYGGAIGRYAIPDPAYYPADVPEWINTTHAPGLPAPVWRHLAVTRSGNTVKVYLQGVRLCLEGKTGCTDLIAPTTNLPTGNLRLGKRVISSAESETQFYGFIDDVAIFNVALAPSQISNLIQARKLNGSESSLIAGYTFDGNAKGVLQQVPSKKGTSYVVNLSESRSSSIDAPLLPKPFQSGEYALPLAKGDVWQVLQAFNSYGSHQGYAAFCWDLIFVPENAPRGQPQLSSLPSNDHEIHAVAAGTIEEMKMTAPQSGGSNILIRHAPNEYSGYLHMKLGTASVATGQSVERSAPIAISGDVGTPGNPHLHFAVSNNPESKHDKLITFPVAFSNYEASDDYGKTWYFVANGMPRAGQWVRR